MFSVYMVSVPLSGLVSVNRNDAPLELLDDILFPSPYRG